MALPRSLPSLAASKTALARTTQASRTRFTAPSTTSACAAATTRAFSSSATRPASHEQHYDPPGGWLWGIPPGQKYENEGWEPIWYWGFFGSLGLAVVAYCYKPDTSIQTWALEEARRRLEAEGILPDPDVEKAGS